MADKLQRNVEINGLLGNHCAPSEGEVAKPESESQGRRFGNIRRAWTLGNDFHHSGQPDAVAKNRISLQVHQSNQRVGENELKTEKNICTYVIYKDRCLYFISWVCHISLDYCRPEIIWKIINRFSFSEKCRHGWNRRVRGDEAYFAESSVMIWYEDVPVHLNLWHLHLWFRKYETLCLFLNMWLTSNLKN